MQPEQQQRVIDRNMEIAILEELIKELDSSEGIAQMQNFSPPFQSLIALTLQVRLALLTKGWKVIPPIVEEKLVVRHD